LIAGHGVTGGRFLIFHAAAKDRGEQAGQKLSDWADQILLVAQHVWWHRRWRWLEESSGERLARTGACRKMRGGFGDLV
jgi:hypothetical protein